jgi:hypothetical protein
MSASTPIVQERFDYAAFIAKAKSSTTEGSSPPNQVNIVDADWRPEFDMEDHNRMCRQLGIVPQCDIPAKAPVKEVAPFDYAAFIARAKSPVVPLKNTRKKPTNTFRLETF